MALAITTIHQVRPGGSDTACAGCFDAGQTNGMFTDGAATLATSSAAVFTSASYSFVAGDVGAWIFIASGGTFLPGWYQIASVAGGAATLLSAFGSGVLLSTMAPTTATGIATTASPTAGRWTIDYSQQNAAQFTYTDLASAGTGLTVSSAAKPFARQHVGNALIITGGTNFNTGRYVIASVASAVVTVVGPTNITTGAGASGTGGMGGAYATLGAVGTPHIGGNLIEILAGTYTQTSASSNVAAGSITLKDGTNVSATVVRGYSVVRGDQGTKPLLKAGSISSFTMITAGAAANRIENLSLDGNSQTSSQGFSAGTAIHEAYRCKFANFTNSGMFNGTAVLCEFTGCATQPAISGAVVTAIACTGYANTVVPFTVSSASYGTFVGCVAKGNTSSAPGFDGRNNYATFIGCVSYGNGGAGFTFSSSVASVPRAINCIATNNTGVGFSGGGFSPVVLRNCATFNNVGGAITGIGNGNTTGAITLLADPFVDAVNGNFALNTVPGGGGLCRGAGIPGLGTLALPGISTPSYPDIGAAQHSDATLTGALLAYDSFTGADSTSLSGRALDTGGTWTQQNGSWTIQSNQANQATTGSTNYWLTTDSGYSDFVTQVTLVFASSNSQIGGVVFRWQDSSNHWYAFVEQDGLAAPYLVLSQRSAGVVTSRGTYTFSSSELSTINAAANATLRVEVVGNSILVFWNGALRLSYTSSLLNTQTVCGLMGYAGGGYTNPNFDDFTVWRSYVTSVGVPGSRVFTGF